MWSHPFAPAAASGEGLGQLPVEVVVFVAALPVIGAIIGYLARPASEILVERYKTGSAAKRDRRTAQAQALRDLQKAITTQYNLGRGGEILSPVDLQAYQTAKTDVTELVVQIDDASVQRLVGALERRLEDAILETPIPAATAVSLKEAFDVANRQVGSAIRATKA